MNDLLKLSHKNIQLLVTSWWWHGHLKISLDGGDGYLNASPLMTSWRCLSHLKISLGGRGWWSFKCVTSNDFMAVSRPPKDLIRWPWWWLFKCVTSNEYTYREEALCLHLLNGSIEVTKK